MKNFASLNGDGQFSLYLNNELAQTIMFTEEQKEAIMFDFASIL